MVMFQCPTESHIFQYSKGGHPIANHVAFWAMSSTNFCSNLSLPWTDTIPPLLRWQWKIMENQWVPHHLVEFCHGTSWLLFGPSNSLDSLIQLGGLVLQPQAETQESYLFCRATARENTWKIHDFKTMWFHGVILPTGKMSMCMVNRRCCNARCRQLWNIHQPGNHHQRLSQTVSTSTD